MLPTEIPVGSLVRLTGEEAKPNQDSGLRLILDSGVYAFSGQRGVMYVCSRDATTRYVPLPKGTRITIEV